MVSLTIIALIAVFLGFGESNAPAALLRRAGETRVSDFQSQLRSFANVGPNMNQARKRSQADGNHDRPHHHRRQRYSAARFKGISKV